MCAGRGSRQPVGRLEGSSPASHDVCVMAQSEVGPLSVRLMMRPAGSARDTRPRGHRGGQQCTRVITRFPHFM